MAGMPGPKPLPLRLAQPDAHHRAANQDDRQPGGGAERGLADGGAGRDQLRAGMTADPCGGTRGL
jgi:hypothetical protein